MGNELLSAIESQISELTDPAQRVASGLRLYLHAARNYPLLAKFLCRPGFQLDTPGNRFYDYLPRHVQQGMECGQFRATQTDAALALIGGTGLMALMRMSNSPTEPDFPGQVVTVILRGRGVNERLITTLMTKEARPLVLPAESLLERSHARFLQAQ